jgi:hypothetical protein
MKSEIKMTVQIRPNDEKTLINIHYLTTNVEYSCNHTKCWYFRPIDFENNLCYDESNT